MYQECIFQICDSAILTKSVTDIHCIVLRNIRHSKEFSGIQGKHQNFDPSILPYGLILMEIKQKKKIKKIKKKKKIKMADSRKGHFPAPPILNIFS